MEDTSGMMEGEKVDTDPLTGKLKEVKPKVEVGSVDWLEEEGAAMLG
jgi:hypothetical protein